MRFRRRRPAPTAEAPRIYALGVKVGRTIDGDKRLVVCHPDDTKSLYRLVVNVDQMLTASRTVVDSRAFVARHIASLATQTCRDLAGFLGAGTQVALTAELAVVIGTTLGQPAWIDPTADLERIA